MSTFGLYFGYAGIVLTLLLLALGTLFLRVGGYDSGFIGGLTLFLGLTTGILTLALMWPLKYDYHHWKPVTGQVQQINKRLVGVGSNDGASERYVVRLSGREYGIDDSRASLLKVGDTVAIKCKKEHEFMQPYGDDGWACRWGSGR